MDDLAWFAARTRARAEKVVRDQLAARDIEAFLPTLTRWSRWKDRTKAVEWPIFAGYCFARFDPSQLLTVVKCPAVAGVVSFSGKPAALPDREIESLRTLVTSDLRFDPVPFIREGALVEVVHGPLKGVVGRLARKAEHARLMLSVEMISQAVSVQVDAADVKPY